MIYEIKFTSEAQETYDAVTHHLRDRWANSFVIKLEKILSDRLSTILGSPLIYPVIGEPKEVRKCVLHKNCSLVYRVFDTTIVVICFWDNRQEPIFKQ